MNRNFGYCPEKDAAYKGIAENMAVKGAGWRMGNGKRNTNTEIYERLISAIECYYCGNDVRYLFLHGGCYWLALTLHKYIPDSVIVFNRKMQHCACLFNQGVYDIRGRILSEGFAVASAKDMDYMRKHFVPNFDTKAIGAYLSAVMDRK